MHELGIAHSIIAAAAGEAARYPGSRAVRVGVRIGPMAGVNQDSLAFCFELAAEQEGHAGLALEVEAGSADELDLRYVELEES